MKHCFGTIFPDVSNKTNNADAKGKVFSLHVGAIGTVHTHSHLEADLAEWEDCQRCEYFRSCYDFCTAKLSMQRMIDES